MPRKFCGFVAAGLLTTATAHAGLEPSVKCEIAKNKEAAKLSLCRQKAYGKHVGHRNDAKLEEALSKCGVAFRKRWAKHEDKAARGGDPCLVNGDAETIAGFVDQYTTDTAVFLADLAPPPNACQRAHEDCKADVGVLLPDELEERIGRRAEIQAEAESLVATFVECASNPTSPTCVTAIVAACGAGQ